MNRLAAVLSLFAIVVSDHVAVAQNRISQTHGEATSAPSVGAPSRAPSFRTAAETDPLLITNTRNLPCAAETCRRTALVLNRVSPPLYTLYSASGIGNALAWLVKCDQRTKPPRSSSLWNVVPRNTLQQLDPYALQVRSDVSPFKLWFEVTTHDDGLQSQCFWIVSP